MSRPTSSKRVFITLGSNIEPEKHLPAAVYLLADQPGVEVVAVSRVYRTAPINAEGEVDPEQADYLNAAVLIETTLPLMTLKKEILRNIEARLGRVRTPDKYAARTIDLDVALYGEEVLGLVIEEPDGSREIVFPDPQITRFAHVALPLADLDPEFEHPVTGETLAEIAARFKDSPGIEVDPLTVNLE